MTGSVAKESQNPVASAEIISVLRGGSREFSPKQQELCCYLINNYQQAVFWTVEELSKQCGTSPATIVRTVKALGYDSYRNMMDKLRNLVVDSNNSMWREIERSQGYMHNDDSLLNWVARDNIGAIRKSMTGILRSSINDASVLLGQSKSIFIVAARSSRAAAMFFYSMLSQMTNNVNMANYGEEELYDILTDKGSDDVIFAISLGGSHHSSIFAHAIEYAKDNGIKTIILTNAPFSEAIASVDVTLYVPRTDTHYSLVPALTVLEALVVKFGIYKKETALPKMCKLEKVLVNKKISI